MLTKKIVDWLLEHSSVELVPQGSLTPTEEPDAAVEEVETSNPE